MAMLDHWHPVLPSRQLRNRPVAVRLAGKDIVLFRAGDRLGALDNCCPHRRMRLSCGQVVQGRLRCPYHGWTFDTCGAGESPGTPKLHTCTTAFDVLERHGAIWVKASGAQAEFPTFETTGYHPVAVLQHHMQAPFELVVDNFTESEHTATTHMVFGYDLNRMAEVTVSHEPTPSSVRVLYVGPSQRLGWLMRLLLGIEPSYHFHDQWTTYYSPVHAVFDHWWQHPVSGRTSRLRWRVFVFFCPVDEHETNVTTFTYCKSGYPGPAGAVRVFRWYMTRMLDFEINRDVYMIDNLADKSPDITGMKLSRFDRGLGLNRERIERIYRGRAHPASNGAALPTRQSGG